MITMMDRTREYTRTHTFYPRSIDLTSLIIQTTSIDLDPNFEDAPGR